MNLEYSLQYAIKDLNPWCCKIIYEVYGLNLLGSGLIVQFLGFLLSGLELCLLFCCINWTSCFALQVCVLAETSFMSLVPGVLIVLWTSSFPAWIYSFLSLLHCWSVLLCPFVVTLLRSFLFLLDVSSLGFKKLCGGPNLLFGLGSSSCTSAWSWITGGEAALASNVVHSFFMNVALMFLCRWQLQRGGLHHGLYETIEC